MKNPPLRITTEEMQLEYIKLGCSRAITREYLYDLEQPTAGTTVEARYDAMCDTIVVSLIAEVLSEKLAEQEHEHWVKVTCRGETRVPASWWQAWKLEHIEHWYARWLRAPVMEVREVRCVGSKKVTLRVEQFAGFPSTPIRTPERLRGPVVQCLERVTAW